MAIAESATIDAGSDDEGPDMDALDADERRAVRARRESMIVVPQTDADDVCIGIYDVFSESGEHYVVVLDNPRTCDCADTRYNDAENCKHRRRIALEINEEGCPAPGQPIGEYADKLAELREELESRREAIRDDLETIDGMLDPLAG